MTAALASAAVPTLVDITKRLDPDGSVADIAELLAQDNEVLQDMTWKEGNLPTGERTTVRAGLPTVAFRALNEGVAVSKSVSAQVDEGAAMLEGYSQVDRKLAILSGNPAQFRLDEATTFFESMNQRMATTVFYGNATTSPKEFTGLAPRYNSLSGTTGDNIINAQGTTDNLRSIWLVVWHPQKITGIYPKGTKAGLFHEDATANKSVGADGYPVGDRLTDANGAYYQGYVDHYEWNCGLSVKDWRYAVRIANIEMDELTKNAATGADLFDLLTEAVERVQGLGGRPAFYMPRVIRSWMRRQAMNRSNALLSLDDVANGGMKMLSFDGIPLRRTDALNVDESQVS